MRLLISALVVCVLVSTAPAALILTVDGLAAPNEIVRDPALPFTLSLGMAIEDGANIEQYVVDFAVSGPGEFTSFASITFPTPMTDNNEVLVGTAALVQVTGSQDWIMGDPPIDGPAVLIDDVTLTVPAGAVGDIVITLSSPMNDACIINGVAVPAGQFDALTIVPEPLTLAMVGLGGLLAVRRRR
ncbi:MAG: PEP-CTERM sorting domain-containing protein [Sedimentisphaerales bacterium]|nr:PEP-CTERM sorting domain-containing protein [Sedimentisphaerales bacterium]